ncbi:hypothetical protein FN976_13400 [Caenimonas sedimenti]|uniref:Peptidase S41 n=1 Tax=Caenimonas sedimenti TaxID=2596921 RepID=A0A562ZQ78_9BURK|nr:S41 family peptidase [Caenimonas sedimenti]TWO70557.1 hypothetical protein FN976_13400 [Caenimonas sedimenti]
MKQFPLWRPVTAALAAAAILAGCGGGGGDAPSPPPSSTFGASSSFEGMCSLADQKKFVRSYLDETYLWYGEIPSVNAAAFNNIPDYFEALLVTTPDVNGLPKDRFSAILPSSQASLPQGLLKNHTDAVPVVKVVTSPAGRRTGYIQFNDHEEGSQDDLITAFRQMQDARVEDLVLDLRYNSGGFLYVAIAAASMVTGPASEGLVFEQLRYNDKRSAETASSFLTFSNRVQFAETQYPRDTLLPQLNLPRLYVLSSNQTCSSSESLVNSLRGINVEVILVGGTTCGKPYGFHRKENCGFAYFPIEFQGFNAKGFGDYTAGFKPTCAVNDNPATAAGSAADPLLTTALLHIDTGRCPAGTASQLLQSAAPQAASAGTMRPSWAGRLLRPER